MERTNDCSALANKYKKIKRRRVNYTTMNNMIAMSYTLTILYDASDSCIEDFDVDDDSP